ncbi:MAG TPA: SPOR domain-containing protein [Gammaproteobacteria bacterium]|nr:SPOR domain-containing protein [Gammaproteobacteria bacterium]
MKDYAKKKNKSGTKKPLIPSDLRPGRYRTGYSGSKISLSAGLWLLAGLGLGILVCTVIWWKVKNHSVSDSLISTSKNGAPVYEGKPSFSQKPPTKEHAKKPRFDFYTLLPNTTQELPNVPRSPESVAQATIPAPPKSSPYIVEAGSFHQFEKAEELKANLALLGVEAKVQTLTLKGKTRHRVTIGPFATKKEAIVIQQRLADNLSLNSLILDNQV